jgi:hypothetical protein
MRSSSIAPKYPLLASRAAVASSHEAGLPMRIALAIVSGSFTTWPSTIGALPAAWKPNILGNWVVAPIASSSL